jgi:hypothetical protein
MSALIFDPIDLALLGVGWARGAGHRDSALSIDRAQELVDTAEMLHRLWMEIDAEEWDGVFAYEVAEPVGVRIGAHFFAFEHMPAATEVEEWAREFIKRANA